MDRVLLERLSSILVIAGFIIGVGSLAMAFRVYGRMPAFDTPGAWIFTAVALAGYVLVLGGFILDQYLKSGSLRQAIVSWALGFALVVTVAVGGYLLRR